MNMTSNLNLFINFIKKMTMKKATLFLFLLACLVFSTQGWAMTVNISGTVTDINGGAPVASHTVSVSSDSSGGFFYYNNVLTDNNGFYSFSIPNVNPIDSVGFTVSTLDCISVWHNYYVSGNTTPITVNFQICTTPPPLLTVLISGNVYEAGTVIPVPNHAVTIASDSSGGFFYYYTVYTNSAGAYSVTINNVPGNTTFLVSTLDCNNNTQSQSVNGNSSPIIVNFYICVGTPPPTGTLWGQVFAGNVLADFARVDLIRSTNDSLQIVDSYYTNDSAGMYIFSNIATGNYILMAELEDNSLFYGQYAPTYYVASLYWDGAELINLGQTTIQNDIHLVETPGYAVGSGDINGNIQEELKSASGTPVSGMEVLLLDQNSQPLAYTVTDVNGNYSFSDISFGTYVIRPEKLSINTTPATITLSNDNPGATVNFTVENGSVFTGISDRKPTFITGDWSVYPNPVTDQGSVSFVSSENASIILIVYDQSGRLIDEMQKNIVRGENTIGFSASMLSNGQYYIKIMAKDGNSSTRKFIVAKH